jgi:murein DD-endopeptidase MepM/ murein hydrolase activator NlpD
LIRALLVGLALLCAPAAAAAAEEMQAPRISVAKIDWDRAAASLNSASPNTPAEAFAALNGAAALAFPGIADSPVPVLLPFDIDGWRKELAASPQPPANGEEIADRFVKANFQASKFFKAGPGGYDAFFSLKLADVPEFSDIPYTDPVKIFFSGFGMTYDLDGPPLPEGELVKDLQDAFPGIRRVLYESYVRYSFERYGATYVASMYCRDTRPRRKVFTCRQADRVAQRFLRALVLAGGTPSPSRQTADPVPLDRPEKASPDFTYYSPGSLIPGSGFKRDLGGRADRTVYARLRFPLNEAPDFANSQSFNNWGDCDFTGRTVRRLRKKDTPYSCKVNGLPLEFDESAPANYSYPWRDNFCEHRNFFVGQCPGGQGHQGQDIRPSSCTLLNNGADRCEPYHHDVVAAHDGMILRSPKQEAVYLFVNTASAYVRMRYIHMSPKKLDADGIVSGKVVHEGEIIGKVGNYNEYERGTSYHLHFDVQVPTKVGWVFVSPYMTLVSAYERLIGARGTEIKEGDPVPPVAGVAPVIEHPEPKPESKPAREAAAPLPPDKPTAATSAKVMTEENAAVRAKPHKTEVHHKHRYYRKRRRHRHHDQD